MKVKPLDFLVIGAAKSGTTTLFYYLNEHPNIYMPANKEAPFFSKDQVFTQGWEHYAQDFFAKAPLDALWGKITPRYMGDLMVPERIYRTMPQVKLLALLRNPADRAFSKYRLLVKQDRVEQSFEEIVSAQLQEKALTEARTTPLPLKASIVVRGEYARILKSYLSYFDREQLLVLFTEDLEQRPQWVMDTILTFIGLEAGFSPPNLGKRYFEGAERQRFPWLIPVTRSLFPLRWLWKALPSDGRRTVLLRFMTQINRVKEPPTRLSPEVRRRLVEFYRPDVMELETLVGRPVPWLEFHQEVEPKVTMLPN